MSAIREKHKAKRAVEHSRDSNDLAKYKRLKNRLKTVIHAAKLNYFEELLQQSHKSSYVSEKLWSQVNDVIGRRKDHKSSICEIQNLSLDRITDFFRTITTYFW